jgi:arsenate reductase
MEGNDRRSARRDKARRPQSKPKPVQKRPGRRSSLAFRKPAKIPGPRFGLLSNTAHRNHGATTMITIYHNPRCSKSRGACELIDTSFNTANEPIKIVEYLREPLTVAQLKELNRMLGCPVRDMVRSTEPEYKDLNLGADDIDDNQLYEALVKHPILLQRPIIVRNGKAVIGRPPENVKTLFDE